MHTQQLARIGGFAAARNCLEVQLVSGNLHQHKTLVCIKALHMLSGLAKVMRHQLAGIAQNKIVMLFSGLKYRKYKNPFLAITCVIIYADMHIAVLTLIERSVSKGNLRILVELAYGDSTSIRRHCV
jgi:hypothetical protein